MWKDWVKLLTPPLLVEGCRKIRSLITAPVDAGNMTTLLPIYPLPQMFPSTAVSSVAIPWSALVMEYGSLPFPEWLTLSTLCQCLKPKRVFEIGTFKGSSTLALAANTPEGTEIFTLDLDPNKRDQIKLPLAIGELAGVSFVVGEHYRGTPFEPKIHPLYGDSASFDFRPYEKGVDLVFIDGNHSYENVKLDSENAFRMLRPGGIIVWDDYSPGWDVVRYLNEIQKQKTLAQISGTRFAVYMAGRS